MVVSILAVMLPRYLRHSWKGPAFDVPSGERRMGMGVILLARPIRGFHDGRRRVGRQPERPPSPQDN